jgi:hypothetical protein
MTEAAHDAWSLTNGGEIPDIIVDEADLVQQRNHMSVLLLPSGANDFAVGEQVPARCVTRCRWAT